MSLFVLFIAGSLVGGLAQPGDWVSLGGSEGEAYSVELLESTREGVVLRVDIPGFYLTEVPADGSVYQRLEVVDAPCSWNRVGLPEVPVVPFLVGVPEGMEAVLSLREGDKMETVEIT